MLDTLMKHAKHFTRHSHEKDVAKVVHFYEDGKLFMTDSLAAVLAHNVNPKQENYTLNVDGSESIVEVYQSYNKFFQFDFSFETELNVGETLLMAQAFEAVNSCEGESETGKFRLAVERGKLNAYYTGSQVRSCYEIQVCTQPFERDFTISLITKSMKLLKDLGYSKCTLKAPVGKLKPVVFTVSDGSIEILVLPCRIY